MNEISNTISFSPEEVFFTSNTHFCHSRVIAYSDRPFADVAQMNEALVRNWNAVVPKDGIVFHLGDFCFGTKKVLDQLNGQSHLILGNHDMRECRRDFMSRFASVQMERMIEVGDRRILLNHYPLLCYAQEKYYWQLFGHIHTNPRNNRILSTERMKLLMPRQYDVGVDNNNFTPVSFHQLEKIIRYQVTTGERWMW